MEQLPQVYRFTWQSIEIEATYTPRKWSIIAHLEIRSIAPAGAPLPITRTAIVRTSTSAAPLKGMAVTWWHR